MSHNIKHSEIKLSNYVVIVSQYNSKLFFEVMPAILKTLGKASTK